MADEINSIPEILRYRSENDGDTKTFSFYDKNGPVIFFTSNEIYTLSGRFASCLREWGFQPGEIIANGLPNSPERLITDFGIMMAGCVLANCQVLEKDGSDFWNAARMSKCRGVITSPRQANPSYRLFSPFLPDNTKHSGIYDVSIQQAPSIQKLIVCDRRKDDPQNSLIENLKNSDKEIFEAVCSPTSLALLFGTSGSSGFSKLIPETHEKLLKNGRMFRAAQDALYFVDRPMGWIGGFPFDFLCFGSRRIVQDKFDDLHADTPAGLWDIISTAKCTGAALLPDAVYELVDHFHKNPPEHKLYFIASGGQAMKKELLKAIGLICQAVVVSYGATEGGMVAFTGITSSSQFKDFFCGKVMDDVQVKMVDDEGNAVETGQIGEIYLKCDRLVKKYYNKSDDGSTQRDIYTPDGWFRTGDRGSLDTDNNLFCYGRKGDVVSIGAALVYLSWPENILNKCPDIQLSSIVGIEEENGNAELCACVVPKEDRKNLTESQVLEFYNSMLMDSENRSTIRLAHVFIMDKLPHLPSGKIHKRELKKVVLEKLKVMP